MSILSFPNLANAPLEALPAWSPMALYPDPANEPGVWYKADQPAEIYAGTNHFAYTESLAAPFWSTYNHTKTTDGTLAPFGGGLATKVIPNTGLYYAILYNSPSIRTLQPNGPRTISMYLKPGGWTYAFVAAEMFGWETNVGACFNLNSGQITNLDPRIESAEAVWVGSGWWRVSISLYSDTDFSTGQSHGVSVYPSPTAHDGTAKVTGDGTNGIYVWGMQMEEGLEATAYDPVLGSWTDNYIAEHAADISNFQESTGSTPVTGVSQPYGLVLDKRFGLVEEADSVVHPLSGSVTGFWSIAGETVVRGGTAGEGPAVLSLGETADPTKLYALRFTVTNFSGDSFSMHTNGANIGAVSANGTYTFRVAGGGHNALSIIPWGGTTGEATISNISFREIPGYHASQPNVTLRPIAPAAGFRWQGDIDDRLLIDASLPLMEMFVNTPFGHYKSQVDGYSQIPLNGSTEIVAKASFTETEEKELADYFGTPRVFLVQRFGIINDLAGFGTQNEITGAGDVELTLIGANGVTIKRTYNGFFGNTTYAADGLTGPMFVVSPAKLIKNPDLETFFMNGQGYVYAGSFPDTRGLSGLKGFSMWGHRLGAPIGSFVDSPLTRFTITENVNTSWVSGDLTELLQKNTSWQYFQAGLGNANDQPVRRHTGTLSEISDRPELSSFWLHHTHLTGVMPTFANCPLLADIGVRGVDPISPEMPGYPAPPKVTGVVPVGPFPVLTRMRVQFNALTGNIPYLGGNTVMNTFNCQYNQITGYVGGGVTGTLGEFRANNNALTEAAVNLILADFVAANRTTGTRILALEGGTNAAPTGQGLTDKATLISRGWTVTTN